MNFGHMFTDKSVDVSNLSGMDVIINTFPKFTFCLAHIVHTTWAKHNTDLAHSVA